MAGGVRIGLVGVPKAMCVAVEHALERAGACVLLPSTGVLRQQSHAWLAGRSAWKLVLRSRAEPVGVVARGVRPSERAEYLDAGADDVFDVADDALLSAGLRAFARRLRPRTLGPSKAFGPVRLEGTVLRVDAWEKTLRPLGSRLMAALCEADGAVVPGSVLVAHAWQGIAVTDGALHFQIHALRRALVGSPLSIECAHGSGYRLVIGRGEERRGEERRGEERPPRRQR